MFRQPRNRTVTWTGGTLALLVPALVVGVAAGRGGPATTADRPIAVPMTVSTAVPSKPAVSTTSAAAPSTLPPAPAAQLESAQPLPSSTVAPSTTAPPVTTTHPAIANQLARTNVLTSTATTVGGRVPVSQLKLVNYTPATAPWLAMWQRYNHARINSDFAAIRGLGANAVRIAIDPSAVGWPTLNATGVSELTDIVATAKANGLSVQFTLFDWYEPYSQVANSISWMRSALSRFAGNPSIALVEVKNEIDVNNPTVLAWTKSMLAALPSILPGVPRTVSVAGSQDLASMRRLTAAVPQSYLDVIDTHLYGIDAVVGSKLAAAQAVANGRPIFVGEMGRSTNAAASACADAGQAAFFLWMQTMLAKANITGFAPWTYTDLDPRYLPAQYVGTPEATYGLRRLDGSWKPAAAIVRTMFASGGGKSNLAVLADQSEPYQYYDGGFECTAAKTPSSTTVSGSDGWTTFDASQVAVAGTAAGQGVAGSTAGVLSNTRGDDHGSIPSLMRSFSLVGNGTVSVDAQVRLVRPTGYTTIALAWFAGNRFISNVQAAPASNTSTGWQHILVAGTPPAGADTLQIHLKSYGNTGTAYFDNVQITNANGSASAAALRAYSTTLDQRTTVLPK